MRGKTLLLLVGLIVTTGCMSIPAKRSPQLDRPRVMPEVEGAPAIRLIVDDGTEQPKRTAKALTRARKTFDFLRNASEDTVDPDYTIRLAVDTAEEEMMGLCEVSFCVFPGWINREVTVQADVADSAGDNLRHISSTGRSRVVLQMHLIWVAPVTVPLMPVVERKMWNNTFRDVFIQAGTAIQEDQASSAKSQAIRVASSDASERSSSSTSRTLATRLSRVDDEVQQHPLDLSRLGLDAGLSRLERSRDAGLQK